MLLSNRHGRFWVRSARRRTAQTATFAVLLSLAPAWAAEDASASTDSLQVQGNTFIPFPFYIYSPETKSGFGLALTYFQRSHEPGQENSKPSTYSGVILATQRKQVVVELGFERYWAAERYQLQGGVTVSKFPDTFYGIGNNTDADVSEDFTPRTVGASVGLRREVAPDLRIGPSVSYIHQTMSEVEPGGVLEAGQLTGSTGGTLVQVGLSAGWDRRDHIVYPRTGGIAELSATLSDDALGSDYLFANWSLDLRRYFSLSRSQVIAVRGLATFMTGTPPFQVLAGLGGDRVMRGYYAGRFRDRKLYALQAEYRLGFWKRMGVNVFADAGDVAHDVSNFRVDDMHFAGGFGLRVLLSKSEGATLRADFGTGDDGSSGMYLSFLEAF